MNFEDQRYFNVDAMLICLPGVKGFLVFCRNYCMIKESRNFTNFTGKYLCWSLSCENCKIFKNTYFDEEL